MIDKDVIERSYGFTIDIHGEIHGLVNGDMGYEPTGIKIDGDTLEIWKLGQYGVYLQDAYTKEDLLAILAVWDELPDA